jgi:hypothetical protein
MDHRLGVFLKRASIRMFEPRRKLVTGTTREYVTRARREYITGHRTEYVTGARRK